MSKPLGKPDRIVVALGGNALGNNPVEQIEADSDRDRWFTAQQALEYGFIDHVYTNAAQIADNAPNQ